MFYSILVNVLARMVLEVKNVINVNQSFGAILILNVSVCSDLFYYQKNNFYIKIIELKLYTMEYLSSSFEQNA